MTPGSSDVAVADLPSTSGAHWANRDNDSAPTRPGGQPTPFRRPPAMGVRGDDAPATPPTPFPPDAASWDAFTPSGPSGFEAAWDAFGAATAPKETPVTRTAADTAPMPDERPHRTGRDVLAVPAAPQGPPAPPEFGPAPPPGSGRVSFGVTDGPIGGPRNADGLIGGPRNADGPIPGPRGPAGPPAPDPPQRADAGRTVPVPTPPRDVTHTGELFLGPGREIRPHRAARRDPGMLPPVKEPPPMRGAPTPAPQPRRSRTLRVVTAVLCTAVLCTVVLLAGAFAGVAYFSGADRGLPSILALGVQDTTTTKAVSAPIAGRTTAGFELAAATTQLRMRAADLGDDLYRITTADDSGSVPRPVITGDRVRLQLAPDGEGGSGIVEVLLSNRVTWALRFAGGADEQIVDLTAGRISSIDVLGSSRRFELALPVPTGTVPVRIAGGLDELAVTSPGGAPVRVQVDSGARTVSAGARTLRDVRPGSTLTPKDWQSPRRYDVDAASRITLLTVENAGA